MGALVAAGGICVPEESLKPLSDRIDTICTEAGFPQGEPFKWSPGRELWMRDNLVDAQRDDFFVAVLNAAAEHNVQAIVVAEDVRYGRATKTDLPEDDVAALLLERIQNSLKSANARGLVIADRPGGGVVREHERFLATRLEILAGGTRFVRYDRILLYTTMPSRLTRILQLADLVTGCTTAMVGGEQLYAPRIFDAVKPLFRRVLDRIGGVGLNIHPDAVYLNLYHWLVGDEHFYRANVGVPLPWRGRLYAADARVP